MRVKEVLNRNKEGAVIGGLTGFITWLLFGMKNASIQVAAHSTAVIDTVTKGISDMAAMPQVTPEQTKVLLLFILFGTALGIIIDEAMKQVKRW